MHHLSTAEEMRNKLIRLFQSLEVMSGRLAKYDNSADPNVNKKDQLKLQNALRYFAINFLKDHSFSLGQLPPPPTAKTKTK
jgi:hypothetical protein